MSLLVERPYVLASHVHHPTGAAVATSPQKPSKTVVVTADLPNETSASAITAIKIGMTTRVRCRLFFKNASKESSRKARQTQDEQHQRQHGNTDVRDRFVKSNCCFLKSF